MRKIVLVVLLTVVFTLLNAQKYITKTGNIDIYSETSLFVIEAKNQKVASILNSENGEVVASTLVRSFKFHEALVEEHFNENYMESHVHPKAVFKGKIDNFNTVDLSKDGTYKINIIGDLTLHGETNPVNTNGKLIVNDNKINASVEFFVSLSAYKIKVEEKYKDRIKDEIKLAIYFEYTKMDDK